MNICLFLCVGKERVQHKGRECWRFRVEYGANGVGVLGCLNTPPPSPFFLKQTIQLYFSFFQIISILFSFTLCLYFYPLNQNKMNNHVLFWVGSSLEESLCIHFVCCMLYFYVLFVLSKFM